MKPQTLLALAPVLALSLFLPLDARVGDSKRELEGRLMNSQRARAYEEDSYAKRLQDSPLTRIYPYLPESAEHVFYFKDDDSDRTRMRAFNMEGSNPGWELHVIYFRGESVAEAYTRIGDNGRTSSISEFERTALLALSQGTAYWKRFQEFSAEFTEKTGEAPAFVYKAQYVRSDGAVYALDEKGKLIFVDLQFDAGIKHLMDEAAAERRASEKEQAPESVTGF